MFCNISESLGISLGVKEDSPVAWQQLCGRAERATSALSEVDVDKRESVHFWEEGTGEAEQPGRELPSGCSKGYRRWLSPRRQDTQKRCCDS